MQIIELSKLTNNEVQHDERQEQYEVSASFTKRSFQYRRTKLLCWSGHGVQRAIDGDGVMATQ